MTSLYQLLKALKTGQSNDFQTAILAKALAPTGALAEAVGSTISLTDCLARAVKNLTVYGKTEVANGQFKDVGKAKVVQGKNLLDLKKAKYASVIGNDELRITDYWGAYQSNIFTLDIPVAVYTLSYKVKYGGDDRARLCICYEDGTYTERFVKAVGEYVYVEFQSLEKKITGIRLLFNLPDNEAYFKELMLERGTEATDYEPYTEKTMYEVDIEASSGTESNTVSLLLDEPLRGIPVADSSLATYTDESGQMWCADDTETKRICKYTFTGTERFNASGSYPGAYYFVGFTKLTPAPKIYSNVYFADIPYSKNIAVLKSYPSCYVNDAVGINLDGTTNPKDYFKKQYDNGTPVEMYYIAAEPTPQPTTYVEQLKGLKLYSGGTTISNSETAYMRVKYNAKK